MTKTCHRCGRKVTVDLDDGAADALMSIFGCRRLTDIGGDPYDGGHAYRHEQGSPYSGEIPDASTNLR